MRELEREDPPVAAQVAELSPLAIVGAGRVGHSLARLAQRASIEVRIAGRLRPEEALEGAGVALLCVPDAAIGEAARTVAAVEPVPPLVGHVSGATPLSALARAAEAGAATFALHPLQTVPDGETELAGAPCAISAPDRRALALAGLLAERLGMAPFVLDDGDRALYHASASIASNLLVALAESAAEALAAAGIEPEEARELLSPLLLRSAANWSERGPGALTGPIARGDEATVRRHREALAERAPQLLPAYDALAERARTIAGGGR